MQTGTYVSAVGHGGLILWVLVGGFLFPSRPPEPLDLTEVTLITAAELDAFSARPPDAAPTPSAPEQPVIQPDPVQPVVSPAPVPAPPVPQPAAPQPDPSPDLTALQPPPTPDVSPEPPAPPPTPDPVPEATVRPDPSPAPAPRVAPTAAPAPAPDARPDPVEREATTPDASATQVQEATEATAPEQAATEIVTEAEQVRAPTQSVRPASRPARPAQAEPTPLADAVSALVAEAVETPSAPTEPATPAAPAGPPLTSGEKDALRVAVERCWNTGSLSSEALRVTVVVSVELTRDAQPIQGSIRMVSFSGGGEAAANQAYEFARRAILRCGLGEGFGLPEEKFDQWKSIEMTFNPDNMRIR